MTCPECGAGRPVGLVGDLLELAHVRPCSIGAAEDTRRHEDIAAAWSTGVGEFDRPTTPHERQLLDLAAVDVSTVSSTRVTVLVGGVRRRTWPAARWVG